MSEETKVVEPQTQQTETQASEPVVEKAPEQTFTQQQLDNIIKQRLDAEKKKNERQLEETRKQAEELEKQKQIQEASTKTMVIIM